MCGSRGRKPCSRAGKGLCRVGSGRCRVGIGRVPSRGRAGAEWDRTGAESWSGVCRVGTGVCRVGTGGCRIGSDWRRIGSDGRRIGVGTGATRSSLLRASIRERRRAGGGRAARPTRPPRSPLAFRLDRGAATIGDAGLLGGGKRDKPRRAAQPAGRIPVIGRQRPRERAPSPAGPGFTPGQEPSRLRSPPGPRPFRDSSERVGSPRGRSRAPIAAAGPTRQTPARQTQRSDPSACSPSLPGWAESRWGCGGGGASPAPRRRRIRSFRARTDALMEGS